MKHHNPHTPILIREAQNISPKVWARYEYGKEKVEDLSGKWYVDTEYISSQHAGLDDKGIEDKITTLVKAQ